jgi:hypothetical protein
MPDRALKIVLSLLFLVAISGEFGIGLAQLLRAESTFQPGLNTRKVELGTSAAYVQAIPFLRDPLALCTGTIPKFLIFYP